MTRPDEHAIRERSGAVCTHARAALYCNWPGGAHKLAKRTIRCFFTHKDSKGTCTHRIASETRMWSPERCGTRPRDVEVINAGVGSSMEVFSDGRVRATVPSLGEKVAGVD
jgi:hypothetical protein